jgi:hypothetical protein
MGSAIFDFASQYSVTFCNPLVIGYAPQSANEEGSVVGSGSGTLLRVGGKEVLVTMRHILEIYRNAHGVDDRIGMHFGGLSFEPRIVDESAATDLAVLEVKGLPFERADPDFPPLRFLEPTRWPADDAEEGDTVFIGGWPEAYRNIRDGGAELHFEKYDTIVATVTGAFYDRFTCLFDRGEWSSRFSDRAYEQDRRMSGKSGGPVFRETRGKVLTFDLVGFVKEHDPETDVLVVSSASNIRSDGTLK